MKEDWKDTLSVMFEMLIVAAFFGILFAIFVLTAFTLIRLGLSLFGL